MPGTLPVTCKESVIVVPEPFVPPETPVCITVQVKIVPGTLLVNGVDRLIPEHIVCAGGVVIAVGMGFTVITTVAGNPTHPFAVGVIV